MNGILLIDKPAGWTSMDVCAKLRGALHEKRIGHSGTLDPMATGLLVVFLGRATRAVEFAEADKKAYSAALRLGMVTDTQDTEGHILSQSDVAVSDVQLDAALVQFRGEVDQIPPMYSAIKVNGQKLCNLARKGREVERAARRITIFSLERSGKAENGDILLNVVCSKGTYIRTLCHDIGTALGCGGVMSALRRTRAGAFCVEDAHAIDAVLDAAQRGEAEKLLLPVETLFSDYASLTLTAAQEKAVRNGAGFTYPQADGTYRVYSQGGEFLALAAVREGRLGPIKSFFEV